jgi:hypothetical protein
MTSSKFLRGTYTLCNDKTCWCWEVIGRSHTGSALLVDSDRSHMDIPKYYEPIPAVSAEKSAG